MRMEAMLLSASVRASQRTMSVLVRGHCVTGALVPASRVESSALPLGMVRW